MAGQPDSTRIVVGHIAGVYGVRGWLKVMSETDPPEGILSYSPWLLGADATAWTVNEGKRHGKGIVVSLLGCDDRDRAAALVGRDIAVVRDQLPPASHDEFYWVDLEGLSVETTEGVVLGAIDHLFATGANDVIVVKGDRERLLPFVWGDVVKDVDFEQRRMLVDWDPSF
ncbi:MULTISPECIES: ribosome maturation factor RimM [unclassified Thiocapsa]|uniref:ribosome maturation factor RimM n=1 Tax=unclassified Thiocapsa TaxID=2641286 RepID=UPI0035B3BFF2